MSSTIDPPRSTGESPPEQLIETIRMLFTRMLDDKKVVESDMHQRRFKRAENKVKGFRNFLEQCMETLNQPLGQDI